MTANDGQTSFFEPSPQPDLFSSEAPVLSYRPEPDKVRARLERILSEARRAERVPWEPSRKELYRAIVPQMTECLPEQEAAQWLLQFESELARLKAA